MEGAFQEKLSSKIENLELSKFLSKNYEKIRIMIFFAGIFSLVGNNKLGVKFVILFVNFNIRGKN